MVKKLISLFILTVFLMSVLVVTAGAKSRIKDKRTEKLSHYGFMFDKKAKMIDANVESRGYLQTGKESPTKSLGANVTNSPGEDVGYTYCAYQQNSTMGRLVDWRVAPQIHFAWTYLLTKQYDVGPRTAAYNIYDPLAGNWPKTVGVGCPVSGLGENLYRFVNLDVMPSAGAVVTAHGQFAAGQPNRTHAWWDETAPAIYCGFGLGNYVPDAVSQPGSHHNGEFGAPKLEYHVFGNDTVTYCFSYEYWDSGAITLFRKEGKATTGTWEAQVIDPYVFFMMQDVTASRNSAKVACVWGQSVPTEGDGSNDVWYWESLDMGATWLEVNKHNVTNYVTGVPGHRSWLELCCLYDSDDNLHIIWNGNVYDGAGAGGRECRLFHWADHTAVISTIHNAEWEAALNCGVASENVFNVAKFNISECNGRMYAIWAQFGDPENGDSTDCADPNMVGTGSNANADLYMSVSTTLDGLLWDAARNLTNTKSPGCDTNSGNECDNELWASMSRFGMDNSDWTGLDWSNASEALTVDPSNIPPYTGTHYLDVEYIADLLPGYSIPDAETPYTYNPVKWFRLPCVDPVIEANPLLSPRVIEYPEFTSHGTPKDLDIVVENAGNADLTINDIFFEKDTEPGSDWIGVDQTSMFVLSGAPDNIDTLVVTLNKGGVIDVAGTVVNLIGRVGLEWDRQIGIDTVFLPISFWVADTVVSTVWDTIFTNSIGLTVGSNGNMGNYIGSVNMDFFGTSQECDDSSSLNSAGQDTIPGDASVYLGDGSPVILTAEFVGDDTVVTASWAIFSNYFDDENGFKPVDGEAAGGIGLTKPTHFVDAAYDCFHTGSFITIDSAVVVEKTYYAPTADADFIVQMMRLFSYDGEAHNGLVIGEAYDWDIPADTGSYNTAGTDPVNDLIYLLGGEFDEPHGDSLECTDNDSRAGGAVRIGYYTQTEYNGNESVLHTDPIWGGYTEFNEDFVYNTDGFVPIDLYRNMMNNEGLNAQPSSEWEDQHIVLTFFDNYSLGASDTLIIWSVMAVVPEGVPDAPGFLSAEIVAGIDWFTANRADLKISFTGCCIGFTGNANCSADENPDISDITRLIDYLYLSHAPLCCLEEADANASGGEPDISDITKLIDHLYLSHSSLPDCP